MNCHLPFLQNVILGFYVSFISSVVAASHSVARLSFAANTKCTYHRIGVFFFLNIKVLSIDHLVIYCPKLRKEAKQNSNSAHFWYQNRFQFPSCVTHGISFNTSELSLLIFKSNNTFYLVGLWKQSNRMLNIVPNTTYNKKC